MADYYPLIVRAVAAAKDAPVDARADVYARARAALLKHLKASDPPLDAETMQREEMALDEAILQVEEEILAANAPPPEEDALELAPDVPRRPVAPIQIAGADDGAPRRPWRLLAGGAVTALLAVGIAAWAMVNREDPARYAPQVAIAGPASAGPASAQPKVDVRVGAENPTAPAADPSSSPAPSADPPTQVAAGPVPTIPATPPATDRATPIVAVAQRAILYEERPEAPTEPTAVQGRAVWRLDSEASGPGQPVDTVVKIDLEFPERQMSVGVTLHRNLDAALPASHLMLVKFTFRAGGGPVKTLASPPTMKQEENQRGAPLVGLIDPIMENYFLIGLSNAPVDIERNISQLQSALWIDLPFRFANDRIGVIAIEKGVQGAEAIQTALARWRN